MNLIELMKLEYDKALREIQNLNAKLHNDSLRYEDRVRLRSEFKEQYQRAIELETEILQLVCLKFRA